MFFKNLFKRFKSDKGITGGDLAIALTLIIVTIGVVTAIYVNITNKVKENIRYSNSVRIATQIIENIQSKNYDYLINYCNSVQSENVYFKEVKGGSGEKLFEVNIPKGYSAKITLKRISSNEVDVVRDVIVDVSYRASGRNNTISLYTVKQKELLEQANPPDIYALTGNGANKDLSYNYYPVKMIDDKNYIVTDVKDPTWYSYDVRTAYFQTAFMCKVAEKFNIGDTINIDEKEVDIYEWIPRYGKINDDGIGLEYLYGTSNYRIGYALWEDFAGHHLYGYMLYGENLKSGNPESASYFENTFEENDGLTGIWRNADEAQNSDKLNNIADTLFSHGK